MPFAPSTMSAREWRGAEAHPRAKDCDSDVHAKQLTVSNQTESVKAVRISVVGLFEVAQRDTISQIPVCEPQPTRLTSQLTGQVAVGFLNATAFIITNRG
jgi:hypothetical protein